MVFICDKFEGKVFEYLNEKGFRILGPPCVLACALHKKPLPISIRPTFCCTMQDMVICFTGFKDRNHLHQLCSLVHLMGGSVRKDVISSVTHVVANTVFGSKYKAAVCFNTPIMSEKWIRTCWESRLDINFTIASPEMQFYKQLPFAGCRIALLGFKQEEEQEMVEIAKKNGAECTPVDGAGLTHLVVSDDVPPDSTPIAPSRVMVVKQQWFWESIQIDACTDEALYPVNNVVTPMRRKRKRHSAMGSSILSTILESTPVSSSSPAGKGDESVSFVEEREDSVCQPYQQDQQPQRDPRYYIANELLQTEQNYVNILSVIVKVFKEPLECPTLRGGPIVSTEDVKGIFGNIVDILEVHNKIKDSLDQRISQWNESSCIGCVFNDQAKDILKVYPPFVNFFEVSKETLHRCDKQYPRFHAFLKANESKAECQRQSLEELLITPIQRIPRIILLLQDLLKRTQSHHPDHKSLMQAVEVVKSTLTNINEDKRKTEKQMLMFKVLNKIEDCPANVLSSTRSFIRELEVIDIGADPASKAVKGEPIVMFLFTDSIEVAKKKSGGSQYKHVEFIPLQHVRSVVTFTDKPGPEMFGLLTQYPEDPQEKLLVFQLSPQERTTKDNLLTQLCGLLADVNNNSDQSQFLVSASTDILCNPVTPGKQDTLTISSSSSIRLKKAIHGARKRVQRAFSHKNKKPLTPSLRLNLPPNQNDSTLGLDDSISDILDLSTSILTPVSALHTSKRQNSHNSRPQSVIISSYNTEV
ncbi:protein ECT2-like isoform X2 [Dysidea avara]